LILVIKCNIKKLNI